MKKLIALINTHNKTKKEIIDEAADAYKNYRQNSKEKLNKRISIFLGIVCFLILCLVWYVNYYMPHGPRYQTGDYVCMNDGRGPCGPEVVENVNKAHIPAWAKFVRNYWLFFVVGLGTTAIILGSKKED